MLLKLDLQIFNGALQAANTDFTQGDPTWCGDYTSAAIQLQYEADATTITGSYLLQASCDPIGENPTNWDDIADSSVALSASASGSVFWNISNVNYNWIRVKFDQSGSSDAQTVTGRIVLKGQN